MCNHEITLRLTVPITAVAPDQPIAFKEGQLNGRLHKKSDRPMVGFRRFTSLPAKDAELVYIPDEGTVATLPVWAEVDLVLPQVAELGELGRGATFGIRQSQITDRVLPVAEDALLVGYVMRPSCLLLNTMIVMVEGEVMSLPADTVVELLYAYPHPGGCDALSIQ